MFPADGVTFFDLNIVHNPADPQKTVDSVRMACRLGYTYVAINQYVDSFVSRNNDAVDEALTGEASNAPPARKKRKKGGRVAKDVPAPFLVPQADFDAILRDFADSDPRKFRQYSRATCAIDDTGMVHNFLKNETIRRYDVIAVIPGNEAIFHAVMKRTEIDLVTFDPRRANPWLAKPKVVRQAVEAGLSLELLYGHVIFCAEDREERRKILASCRRLWRVTKRGAGLILSSGAEQSLELRAPFDVCALAAGALGLGMADGRRALSLGPDRALRHAQTRLSVGSALLVQDWQDVPEAVRKHLATVPEFRAELTPG